ncbi:phage N-6-adenine-methyltransferase [Morganella morganii]|uniref:phage N-6-adenine-methyltransferase n=1 Tax=Morganella morganii TaxID=582 RepID=UPI00061EEEE7|nr:phage N-6-adenine-methyltransferase [Morganella morganii]KJY06165.1 putative BsuMI modification methylase subunit YdiP [Morganella morganii]
MSLTYGSVCSGIEAASVAWEPVGMKPLWFSETEPFPSAVLAAHWPQVDNLGDMTKLAAAVRAGDVPAPDLLVGGTPCQAFSVAGLRGGLSDERGQLTLSYVELADSIDEKREQNGEQPAIIVWENVPGVLSSKDNALGCFLAGLAGESEELKPTGEKWTNVGYVSGPKRTIAWRILDAQYFGVAQRRRRVFVVASARTDICPAEILFEYDSLRGDITPCGEAEKEITGTLTARTHGGGGLGTDFECNGGLVPVGLDAENYPANIELCRDVVAALTKNGVGATGADDNQAQAGHLIAGAFRMAAFGEYVDDETASTVKARDYKDATDLAVMSVHGTQDPDVNHELAHTLGRNHGQENACIAFSCKDYGADATENLSPTLRAGNSSNSNQNSGQPPAIALAGNTIGRAPQNGGNGTGYDESGVSYTLTKSDIHGVSVRNSVRRLTPVECERLQGFPDNHTQISWRGKDAADCPDGPRYRAIGNSMAVPVMRWIGERILAALPETQDLRSDYVIALEELRNKPAHMLKEVGDQWRTPDALYWGINAKFGPCTLDLFTDGQNSKCPNYYTAEDNALTQDWSEKLKELGGAAYGNPPYSRATYHDKQAVTGMVHIMEYAQAMREKGGRYVFLLKAATSETWWPEWADHVAFIRGRIGFDLPDWFVPANEKQKPSGAFFAGAVVILDKDWQGDKISYISRDELIAIGELFMQQARWLVEKTGEAA